MQTSTVMTNEKTENDKRCKGKGNVVLSLP
jgi:hypothetical protein